MSTLAILFRGWIVIPLQYLSILVAVAVGCSRTPSDSDKLQGRWRIVEVVRANNTEQPQNSFLEFSGDRFKLHPSRNGTGTFSLDEDASPRRIVLRETGEAEEYANHSIYRFEKDDEVLMARTTRGIPVPTSFYLQQQHESFRIYRLVRESPAR